MNHPKITNTSNLAAQHIKVLVHGPSGAGKTRLCGTTDGKPLIISAEAGLLSLAGQNLDVWEVKSLDDLKEVFTFLRTDTTYDWVCLDSISEIAEVVLAAEKATKTQNGKPMDGRLAYMNMADQMTALIRAFRDLPKNVYMSAKQGKVKDEITGGFFHGPSTPGQNFAAGISYFFDEVFALQNWKDAEGNIQSALQTRRDAQYEAKDRSGKLDLAEPPHLGKIRAKIIGTGTPVPVPQPLPAATAEEQTNEGA